MDERIMDNQLRICLISREYPSYGENFGAARWYSQTAASLAHSGHKVHVVAQGYDGSYVKNENGVYVHRIAFLGRPYKRGSLKDRISFQLVCAVYVRNLCRRERIDVVDTQFFLAESLPFILIKNSKVVIRYTASSRSHYNAQLGTGVFNVVKFLLFSLAEVFACLFSDAVVANSKQSEQELLSYFPLRFIKSRIIRSYEYERAGFSHFTPLSKADEILLVRQSLGLPKDAKVVLWVNRFTLRKGVKVMLEALPYLKTHFNNLVFVAIGEDEDSGKGHMSFSEKLKQRCQELGVASVFPGYVNSDTLLRYYQSCDVVVCPSLHETFGWVPLEALSVGKPVVATKTGILGELSDFPPRLAAVQPGDVDSFVRATMRLLEGPNLIPGNRAFCMKLLKKLRDFNNIEHVYRSVLQRNDESIRSTRTGTQLNRAGQ